MLDRLLDIDFNPEVHDDLKRRGIASIYGDVSTWRRFARRHSRRGTGRVTITDTVLKGTHNLELLRKSRRLCPRASVVVTAGRTASALELYEAGADYVLMPGLQSAAQMASILTQGLERGFESLRTEQLDQLRRRNEVLQ